MATLTLTDAIQECDLMRQQGRIIVFTNGHFDLLHAGHLDYLEKARVLGDALIVGLNGDASTRLLKGEGRPIIPAEERARLLSALRVVDGVVIFEEATAESVLHAMQPDIYVKGGDYTDKPLPERAIVEAYGGRVVLIDYLPDHSTTNIITKVRALP